jgi:hypothetical protein
MLVDWLQQDLFNHASILILHTTDSKVTLGNVNNQKKIHATLNMVFAYSLAYMLDDTSIPC